MKPTDEQIKKARDIVLDIRQYLIETEFAPEPKTPDPKKLCMEFPQRILDLMGGEKQSTDILKSAYEEYYHNEIREL